MDWRTVWQTLQMQNSLAFPEAFSGGNHPNWYVTASYGWDLFALSQLGQINTTLFTKPAMMDPCNKSENLKAVQNKSAVWSYRFSKKVPASHLVRQKSTNDEKKMQHILMNNKLVFVSRSRKIFPLGIENY